MRVPYILSCVELAHRLTVLQLGYLDHMIRFGEELVGVKHSQKQAEGIDQSPNIIRKPLEVRIDRASLQFRISLLDHTLKDDLFKSSAVGFLTALAVDSRIGHYKKL